MKPLFMSATTYSPLRFHAISRCRSLAGSRAGHGSEVLLHRRETHAARLRSFHQALKIPHPLGQVHLVAKSGEVGLDLGVLEVHLLAGVIDQRGIESAVAHEGGNHVPIAVNLKNEAAMAAAGGCVLGYHVPAPAGLDYGEAYALATRTTTRKKETAHVVHMRPLFMLRRFAGVSEAGACRRNPERSEGSLAQKGRGRSRWRTASIYVGDDLLSHTLSRAVQSALRGLTSVFGMGTGISPAVKSPASLTWARLAPRRSVPQRRSTQDLLRRSWKELSPPLLTEVSLA
jgi:hypothetical protein